MRILKNYWYILCCFSAVLFTGSFYFYYSAQHVKHRADTLFSKIKQADVQAVKELLVGVPINTTSAYGNTFLHFAALEGNKEIVRILLTYHASVTFTNQSGNTPLHMAAMAGDPNIIKMLIQAGSSINAQDKSGYTPLHWAVRYNHLNALRALLSAGARRDIKDSAGNIPLYWAERNRDEQAIRLLAL